MTSYSIDWESQWKLHGCNFRDGFSHIDLTSYQTEASPCVIKLKPGPGFGDLSHATTKMMLQLMGGNLYQKSVLDIGCGSGILTLAAAGFGANKAYGFDIDLLAVEHAIENTHQNNLEKKCRFGTHQDPISLKDDNLWILMNMIHTEQKQVLAHTPELLNAQAHWITSGILVEEHEKYLNFGFKNNWTLKKKIILDGWMAFVWSQNLGEGNGDYLCS